jgi:hypothetical protein
MAIVNKTAPWFTFLRKMESLFGRDPEIKINMTESVKTIGTDPFAGLGGYPGDCPLFRFFSQLL